MHNIGSRPTLQSSLAWHHLSPSILHEIISQETAAIEFLIMQFIQQSTLTPTTATKDNLITTKSNS